ncbi:MAG: DUF1501 domain-containing protein [Planctomycetaceae bacterium]|nr:DUF1501 domain-containing protein [Planctomycetaceae bacterium]
MHSFASSPSALSRRELVRLGSWGMFGLSLPQLWAGRGLAASTEASWEATFGRAKQCIFLFMWGGPAHQDTWDLKPKAPREVRGEFQPISTVVPDIFIGEHFPQLAQRTDKLAIIRSMTHDNVDHTTSTHYLLTGQPPPPGGDLSKDWPSIGSVLAKLNHGKPPMPPFVSMRPTVPGDVPRFVEQSHGQFSGWLPPTFNPLVIDADPATKEYRVGDFAPIEGVDAVRMARRRAMLNAVEKEAVARPIMGTMAAHYSRAFDLLDSPTAKEAFDLSQEPIALRERYGMNPHGQSVLQARRLIERGVALTTIFWPNDGTKNVSVYWDTHSRNFTDLKTRLMPAADQAFSALLDDLQDRGMLDETLVIWSGEFGRTPKIGQRNSDAGAGADGRDHWPNCFTTVLAGGGVPGGRVYGSSDRFAAYPASDAVRPVDLTATIYHLLGVPPHLELRDAQNRPLVVCPGDVLHRLLQS